MKRPYSVDAEILFLNFPVEYLVECMKAYERLKLYTFMKHTKYLLESTHNL